MRWPQFLHPRPAASQERQAGFPLARPLFWFKRSNPGTADQQAPLADALDLPGRAGRPLPAVAILEADDGKPVFTSGNTQAWHLIHDGIALPVEIAPVPGT